MRFPTNCVLSNMAHLLGKYKTTAPEVAINIHGKCVTHAKPTEILVCTFMYACTWPKVNIWCVFVDQSNCFKIYINILMNNNCIN